MSASLWDNLTLVTPVSLAVAIAAAIALLGSATIVVARGVFERPGETAFAEGSSKWRPALWFAMLFLVVFLAKLSLMRSSPVMAPFWDQWDGEAAVLFVPFHDDSLGWSAMIGFHNEHRILFTRLLALGLLAVDGQWDPRLEQVVNAGLHSLAAVVLAAIFWIAGGRRRLDVLVFASAVAFALPFAWENTLVGFQSQFYFLVLFSLLALWLTTSRRPSTGAWWLGWLCAICSLFTAAGGLITPLAISVMIALKFADERRWRDALVNGGAAALVLALGIAIASPPLAHHAPLKATTLGEFRLAMARSLAWPWIDWPALGIVMWLPLGCLLIAASVRRARTTQLDRIAIGLGLWVVLTAGALAYGRGAGAPLPAPRYQDFLSLGFVVNAGVLAAFVDKTRASMAARRIAVGMLVAWLSFAMVGVDRVVGRALTDLGVWRQYFAAHTSNLRTFMITNDLAGLKSKRALVDLPYPDSNRLASLLQDPNIRRILPAAVRRPLRVEPQVSTNDAFVLDGPFVDSLPRDPLQRSWLSLSALGRKAQGRFESRPLSCELGIRLKFQLSGYLGWEGQHLSMKDSRTGNEVTIMPTRPARESWTDVTTRCPSGPFQIVAIDDTAESWFGFREPVEIGWASVVAESLIQNARAPLIVLLTVAALGLAVRWT
jgi:hypothetical protein